MTLATNIRTVPVNETPVPALQPASPPDEIPALAPLAQSTGTAVVVTDAVKPRFGMAWLARTPKVPPDPHMAEANGVHSQSTKLHEALASVHRALPYDASILQLAPQRWEQIFTSYDASRASAIALLSGLKVRLDAAAQTGATAALTTRSRARFEEAANNIRAADAECASLRGSAQARHAQASEAAAIAARVAAEKVAQAEVAMTQFEEDLANLSGPRRADLEGRINKLWLVNYRFGYPFTEEQMQGTNHFTMGIVPGEVLPALASKKALVFGRADAYSRLYTAQVQPIESVAALEKVVALYAGKGEPGSSD